MAYHLRWRRAVIISVLCHAFLLIGAGYLSAHMFSMPNIEEKYVELELINELHAEKIADNEPSSHSSASAPQSPLLPSKVQQERTAINPSAAADTQGVVTTAALSVTGFSSSGASESGSAAAAPAGNGNNQTGSKGKSGGIIPPSILDKTNPSYPQSARSAGIEGTVLLKIEILATGQPGDISISRSSGNEALDNAAISAVRQWRFVPAKDKDKDQPISCYTTIPISFRLK